MTDLTRNSIPGADGAATLRDRASAAVDQISDRAADVRDDAGRMASKAADKMASLGREAANTLDATTRYFREHDAKAIANDAKEYARTHPTQALLGAAAVGFLFAVLLRRR